LVDDFEGLTWSRNYSWSYFSKGTLLKKEAAKKTLKRNINIKWFWKREEKTVFSS